MFHRKEEGILVGDGLSRVEPLEIVSFEKFIKNPYINLARQLCVECSQSIESCVCSTSFTWRTRGDAKEEVLKIG